jgi:hypothetical protein
MKVGVGREKRVEAGLKHVVGIQRIHRFDKKVEKAKEKARRHWKKDRGRGWGEGIGKRV